MGSFVRCVYIPMPRLNSAVELGAAMTGARATGTSGVMDGLTADEGWLLYHVKQREIDEAGQHLATRFGRKRGGCQGPFWYGTGGRPLQGIRSHRSYPAALYVHCHGNSEVVGFRPLMLNPAQLVARLMADGLPLDGQPLRIKLWSCHSGETAAGKTQSFLEQVTRELRRQAFYNVEVFGYRGELRVNGSDRGTHKLAQPHGEAASRARDRRTGWNTGGDPDEDEDAGVYFLG